MIKFEEIKSNKKLCIVIIAVLAVIILAVCGLLIYNNGLGPVDENDDEAITVEIPSGSGAISIIDILDEIHGHILLCGVCGMRIR